MSAKERLEEYIKEDKIYNDWLDQNTSYVSDFDKFCIQHCLDIKEILEENQELKRQLEYLRSGEYLNQLKYERNLLESIVQDYEIPKEDKEFIDMTHRNTELLEQIDKAIKYIKETNFWGLYDDTPMQEVLYGEELLKILGGDVDDE